VTSEDDAGSDRTRSPIEAAAFLLGIYVALYLTVGLMIRVLNSPEAAATIPPQSSAVFATPATASISAAPVAESAQVTRSARRGDCPTASENAARMPGSITSAYSTDLDDGNAATDLMDSNGACAHERLIPVRP
jgi:hypothetical protein